MNPRNQRSHGIRVRSTSQSMEIAVGDISRMSSPAGWRRRHCSGRAISEAGIVRASGSAVSAAPPSASAGCNRERISSACPPAAVQSDRRICWAGEDGTEVGGVNVAAAALLQCHATRIVVMSLRSLGIGAKTAVLVLTGRPSVSRPGTMSPRHCKDLNLTRQ